jgi:hypothetical protein
MTKVIRASGEWYCQGHPRLVASCSKCLRRGGSLLSVGLESIDDYGSSHKDVNISHILRALVEINCSGRFIT